MSITFVTAFFDIGRKTEEPLQKYDNYFAWITKLLELPINLCFYTTQDIHDKLVYTPRSNLKFIITDKIPMFDKLSQIKTIWPSYITNNREKDTAEFACLSHSKFHFLKQAIEDNPFNSTHYGWIDAGLLKIAKEAELIPLLNPPDKVKLLLMNYINKDEVLNPAFVRTCRYKIAGGLFIGPKAMMKEFTEEIINLAIEDINKGNFGLEQEYMAIIYCRRRELFSPYYGDFCDLIYNYNMCQRNKWLPERVLQEAIRTGDIIEQESVVDHL